MPELPEVEVVRQQLAKNILNKKIIEVEVRASKVVGDNSNFSQELIGQKIKKINRVGKLLIFETDKKDLYLLGHLRMTGQLIYVDPKGMAGGGHTLSEADLDLPHKHTHLIIRFTGGAKLYYNDVRRFGYLKTANLEQVEKAKSGYGVEPISDGYNLEDFINLLTDRKTNIKALLLNQKYLAGLGNIYVDEACYRARVRPDRPASSLNSKEQKDLFKACRDVLIESIKAGGTTFYDFRNAGGGKGNFFKKLKVFQREGKKCYRCKGDIVKGRVAGRGTHWCSSCQV